MADGGWRDCENDSQRGSGPDICHLPSEMRDKLKTQTMWFWLLGLVQLLGILSAIRAIMGTRTAQGAVAWSVALIAFPYAALPLFWIFGRRKFEGYVIERRGEIGRAHV